MSKQTTKPMFAVFVLYTMFYFVYFVSVGIIVTVVLLQNMLT